MRHRRAEAIPELLRLLYGSLIQYLQDHGLIAARDFDAAPCTNATLADISPQKLKTFIERARDERAYALAVDTPPAKALAHLNLMAKGTPAKGAVLLFAENPGQFVPSCEIACLHFHGTEILKPIPTQQVYRGTVFELVDKAVDFVMSRMTRAVTPSASAPQSIVKYEVPYAVVREAIVNAVAHRNYASKSGVQVTVFADRIEVWNPGALPEDLTAAQLRVPHPSVPRNRLLCEPLFLAHCIERAGTGTLDMIRLCAEAGLPEPEFRSEGERFVTVIWRDWLIEKALTDLKLSDRQQKAIRHIRIHGRIANLDYQRLFTVSKPTASRDLEQLRSLSLLAKIGSTAKGTYYVLNLKRLTNGSKGSPKSKGSQRAHSFKRPAGPMTDRTSRRRRRK